MTKEVEIHVSYQEKSLAELWFLGQDSDPRALEELHKRQIEVSGFLACPVDNLMEVNYGLHG